MNGKTVSTPFDLAEWRKEDGQARRADTGARRGAAQLCEPISKLRAGVDPL
jgi:hypothetical protein